jgi:hypothetical protein
VNEHPEADSEYDTVMCLSVTKWVHYKSGGCSRRDA